MEQKSSIVVHILENQDVHNKDKIKAANLGKGFNILDGSVKGLLFDQLNVRYADGKGKEGPKISTFRNYGEYERELAIRTQVKDFEEGMFSLCHDDNENLPFLCLIDKTEESKHLIMELEDEFYKLFIHDPSVEKLTPNILEDVAYIRNHPFSPESKQKYYQFIEQYGTHFIKEVSLGAKAELRWSFKEKAGKDALSTVTKTQRHRKQFYSRWEAWEKVAFRSLSTLVTNGKYMPKSCSEAKRVTHNFGKGNAERLADPAQIQFHIQEVSTLFHGSARSEMEVAVRVYLEEMKPARDPQKLTDGLLVGIFCLDKKSFIRVDDHGHLFADSQSVGLDCKFEIKKKGNKIGLKSVVYGHKYVSSALTRSYFSFHRLQFMGPHESFQLNGDYLMACGNFSSASFIYVGEERQLFQDGTYQKKNRFCLLQMEPRHDSLFDQNLIKEPLYEEDTNIVVEMEPTPSTTPSSEGADHPMQKTAEQNKDLIDFSNDKPKQNQPLKKPLQDKALYKDDLSGPSLSLRNPALAKLKLGVTPRSNSTSSLFIKDTINLPDLDELIRCVAKKIHLMITESSGKPEKERVVLDVFSEEKFPLTKHLPSFFGVPSVESINHFLSTIVKVEKLNPEPLIMSLVYVQRVIAATKITLQANNWRRLFLSGLMIGAKVWEDQSVWNVDFLELFPNTTVKDFNHLEKHMLKYLQFNVSLKASEYAKNYFELRQFSDVRRTKFVQPLNEEGIKKLEVHSAASERRYAKQLGNRSVTYSDLDKKPKSGGLGILS